MSVDPFADGGIDWEAFDPDAAVASARGTSSDALTPASRSSFLSSNDKRTANDNERQQPEAKKAKTVEMTGVISVTPTTITSDWAALPSDLIRRIGQLHEGHWFSCGDFVDPVLEMRLGNDPFNKSQLKEMTARVVATRLPDMAFVELSSSVPVEQYWLEECRRIEFECERLPVDRFIFSRDEVITGPGWKKSKP